MVIDFRRERNRIHAKMTRDRKKSYIANISKIVQELESNNRRINSLLKNVVQNSTIYVQKFPSFTKLLSFDDNSSPALTSTSSLKEVTPVASPTISSMKELSTTLPSPESLP